MFLPSNLHWHADRSPSIGWKENRRVFGGKEILESFKAGTKEGGSAVWSGIKVITWPARMTLWPVYKPLLLAWKASGGLFKISKKPAYIAKHAAKGVVVETVAKSSLELAKPTLNNLRINLIENARCVLKSVFALPMDAISYVVNPLKAVKAPFVFFKELWKRAKETRKSVSGVLGNAWKMEGRKMLKCFKDSVLAPIRVPAAAALTAFLPITAPHVIQMGDNIVESQVQYLTALDDFQKQIRAGFNYTLDAGKHGHDEWKGIEDKKRLEKEAKNKDKDKDKDGDKGDGKDGNDGKGGKGKDGKGKGKGGKPKDDTPPADEPTPPGEQAAA